MHKDSSLDSIKIIAEAGVNHNGSLASALDLCSVALDAGADVVKFQTWTTDEIICSGTPKAEYQILGTDDAQSQYSMLKELELSFDDFYKIKNHCDSIGIEFMSTPDDVASLKFLVNELGLRTIKVGSGEIRNTTYLSKVASLVPNIILSTGMHSLADIAYSVEVVQREHVVNLSLLQCTSSYPCPYNSAHLNVIPALSSTFQLPVGFSDHTNGLLAGTIAASLGASIIEKHFTTDKSLAGPDHAASLSPNELVEYINNIRNVPILLGSSLKSLQDCEIDVHNVVSKRVVAIAPISPGDLLTEANIGLRRSPDPKSYTADLFPLLLGTVSQRPYDIGNSIHI